MPQSKLHAPAIQGAYLLAHNRPVTFKLPAPCPPVGKAFSKLEHEHANNKLFQEPPLPRQGSVRFRPTVESFPLLDHQHAKYELSQKSLLVQIFFAHFGPALERTLGAYVQHADNKFPQKRLVAIFL